MNRFPLTVFISLLIFSTSAQKVGLVLSGGAAKGLAHVGVLKALEENEIPIDYIVGTSMGGIIAGCYAAGMSPDQIENMALSEQFLRLVNGMPEKGFNYFYHQNEDDPHFLKLNLSLDSILNMQLNTSIASDVSLNFALADMFSRAAAISNNNFDSLFVPLRVVTADIFTQNQVILKKGILSDAIRATQTVPFFYNPIRVDGKYLFDGGVYNNFPVDVAENEFKPDVIIGANVSSKIYNDYPYSLDEKLIANSLLFLLLDKSDPGSVPENGVYIQPNLTGYTSFDFGDAKSLIDSGYVQTLRQIEEIKEKVASRAVCEDIAARRNAFNSRSPELEFDRLVFEGFNSKQRRYIRRIFRYNERNPKSFYYTKTKRGYFKLVSEDYFSNVYPNILFDTTLQTYQLKLTRRPQKNFQVDFGGVIATRNVSNIYLGLNFYNFNNQLLHVYTGFQTGNFYKSADIKTRLDFPFQFYVEPFLGFNSWDFLQSDDLLYEVSTPTVLRRINRKFGMNIGRPFGNQFKGTLRLEGFNNIDRYVNGDVFVSSDTLDALRTNGTKGELVFTTNTLNRKQYANAGKSFTFTVQYFNTTEDFEPGNTSVKNVRVRDRHQWFRFKATAEHYFKAGWYRPGYYAQAVFSNQPFFQNYFGTLINAPGFNPLHDSPSLLLENFRSFNYISAGIRNVFILRNRLDLRLEAHVFKPVEYLQQGLNQEAVVKENLPNLYFASTAALVLHSPMGPISLSVNYYDDKQNQIGVLLHVGYLLYNKHSLD
ncbi:MAG: patatin-like phospholipase family protein [Cyclobacteriaceae bacterium]